MRTLWISVCFMVALAASAQSTTVTGTTTDTDSIPWASGNYNIQFTPNPANPNIAQYQWTGGAIPTVPLTGQMDNTGTFSISLPSNTSITPSGSTWKFTICPNATRGCLAVNIPVTGATMNVSSTLSAAAAGPRFSATPGAYGYADVEISPLPIPGGTYFNVSSLTCRQWNGASWQGCGTGTGIVPNPPTFSVQIANGSNLNSDANISETPSAHALNNEVWAGLGTTANIQALLNGATTVDAGIMHLMGGQDYTTTATTQIGTDSTITSLMLDPNSIWTINSQSGNGITMANGTCIFGNLAGTAGNINLVVAPTFNGTDVIGPLHTDGTEQSFCLDQIHLLVSNGAQVSDAAVKIDQNYTGTRISNSVIYDFVTGIGLYITGENAATSDIYLDHVQVTGNTRSNASGKPVMEIFAGGGTGGVRQINMNAMDLEGPDTVNKSPLLLISGGSPGSNLENVLLNGLDCEDSNTFADCVDVHNSQSVSLHNVDGTGGGNAMFRFEETGNTTASDIVVDGNNLNDAFTVYDEIDSADRTSLGASVVAGATSMLLNSYPHPILPGQTIAILDGANYEKVTAAWAATPYSANPVLLAAPGFQFNHAGANISYNPEVIPGPGLSGSSGESNSAIGGMVADANGVTTVTLTNDSHVNQDQVIGRHVYIQPTTSDLTFAVGDVRITGLGAFCTSPSVTQMTCGNNQFQFQSAAVSYTNVAAVTVWTGNKSKIRYDLTGDIQEFKTTHRVHQIAGPLILNNDLHPQSITMYALATSFNNIFSKMFMGAGNPRAGTVSTDFYFEPSSDGTSNSVVTIPDVHYTNTGTGNVWFGVGGNDKYELVQATGLLTHTSTGHPLADMPATPGTNTIAEYLGSATQLGDSGVSVQNLPHLNTANTWSNSNLFDGAVSIGAQGTATALANFNSFNLARFGSYWDGTTHQTETCLDAVDMGSGTNPTVQWQFNCGGSPGITNVAFVGFTRIILNNGTNSASLDNSGLTANEVLAIPNVGGSSFTLGAVSGTPTTGHCLQAGTVTGAIVDAGAGCTGANLSGTSGSIGGGALTLNSCASGTVTVTGVATTNSIIVTPASDPNTPGTQTFDWYGVRTASNTVTVYVCALVAGTPGATTYNVRAL